MQVNSHVARPGAEPQADEPFPGTVMRTSADEDETVAQVGFSPDGEVGDGSPASGGDGGGAGTPGAARACPACPTDLLEDFGDAITGGSTTAAEEPEPDPSGGAPGLPPELAALVDFDGLHLVSQTPPRPAARSSRRRPAPRSATCRCSAGWSPSTGVVSPAWSAQRRHDRDRRRAAAGSAR